MIIVCVSDDHNSSVSIMKNGEIVYASSEERFTQIKNDSGFPLNAINAGLKNRSIKYSDIDKILITSTMHFDYMAFAHRRDILLSVGDHKNLMKNYWLPKIDGLDYNPNYPMELLKTKTNYRKENFYGIGYLGDSYDDTQNDKIKDQVKHKIVNHFGIKPDNVKFIDHHSCHIYYSYFSSKANLKDRVIAVSIDAWGDGRNQTVWDIKAPDNIKLLADSAECELARLYRFTTLYLSMKPLEHEYKVMGLAPYAKSEYSKEIKDFFHTIVKVDGMKVLHRNRPKNLYKHLENNLAPHRFDNIARGLQDFIEEVTVQLFKNISKITGCKRFVYSGGVAMNVKVNKLLHEQDFVDYLYVPGAPDDTSTVIGGCYFENNNAENKPLSKSLYLGDDIIDDDVKKIIEQLNKEKYDFCHVKTLDIAKRLSRGQIIGRASGKMEFGARALGNRSILALPNNWNSVKLINEAIKGRDFWMPFAGSIIEEDMNLYIKNPKNIDASHMTICFDTVEENYEYIKAATHRYDGTIRPQIVKHEHNPWYHTLLSEIKKLTGHPVLLNTSLNIHGFPIVRTADEAFHVFIESGLNHIIIGKYLFSKK